MMLVVFHKPLGLSDDWQWPPLVAATACWIPLFILQRRRRNARLAAGLPVLENPPTKGRFWLSLLLIVAMSLAGPLWLPYTGLGLPTSDAPRHLSYHLCFGRPRLSFRLALLEQKSLTSQ